MFIWLINMHNLGLPMSKEWTAKLQKVNYILEFQVVGSRLKPICLLLSQSRIFFCNLTIKQRLP